MASIKIKFRPSTVEGREGGIYFQIIQNRVIRQMNTDYKVYAYEWDAEMESVVVSGTRANILCGIKERLEWDLSRLEKVVRQLEQERRRYTADDVITLFHKVTKETSLFSFMHSVIAQLKQLGKSGLPRPIQQRSKVSWSFVKNRMFHLMVWIPTLCFCMKPI